MISVEKPLHMNVKNKDDIAEVCLMPGDPLRAKYIAEKFLKDAKLVTNVRNMLGFTGYYKNKKVTVMGSGMGMPSVSIYAFELMYFFNVKKIIRIGTCGVVDPKVKVPDVILADSSYSETNFDYSFEGEHHGLLYPDKELNDDIIKTAKEKNVHLTVGGVLTTDVFGPYLEKYEVVERVPKDIKIVGEEMEAYALFLLGERMHRKTSCLLTVTDNKFSNVVLTPEERQNSLDEMIILALDSIIK